MQRVHISPILDKRKVDSVTTQDVERLARQMLVKGSSRRTVRNVMTFLHSIFASRFAMAGRRRIPWPTLRGRADGAKATPIPTSSS